MNQTPTNKKKALIVGDGTGGLVAAMALQRAGIEAVVYEAYDTLTSYAGLFLNTVDSKTFSTGVVYITYQAAGKEAEG